MDFGTIAAKMTLDISNFTNQLNLAQNQAQRLALQTSKSFQIGSALTGIGKVLTTGLTLPILGAATAAVKVGNEFQAQMSRVQAIAGATGGELDKMKQQAIQLGAKTAFSAKEAAQGMENLASAGFSVNEIMNAMPGTLDLAAVSGGDVAQSAEAMASSLRAFGLEANQAGHVADVFARAAADTNAETVDMAEAMKYVAPVAHSMGLSLEETAASIGIMADAGIKGSQAGTTLRGALSRIAKPTKAMTNSMNELGVSFYDAEGKMIPLREQIGQLKKATAGLTQEERNRHLVTLYGQQSLSGMLALLEAGPEKLEKMTNSLINSDGAAKQMAETMQDNLKSKIEQMGGAFESAAIIIQQILEPALKKIVSAITKVIEAFVNMSPIGQKMVVIFSLMVAALGPLLLIVGTAITTFAKLKIAIQFLGPAFMGTMGTISLVIGIIYALVAVFMIAYTKSETFRNFVNKLGPAIKQGLGIAIEWTVEKLKIFGEWLKQAADKARELGSAVGEKLNAGISKLGSMIGITATNLREFAGGVMDRVNAAFSALGNVVGITSNSLGSFVGGVLERMRGAFGKLGGVIAIAVGALTKVGLAMVGISGPLGLAISLIVSFISAWVRTGQLNADGITQVFDNLSNTIQSAADAISTYLPVFVQKGTEILVKLIEGITNAIPGIVSVISQIITTIVTTLSTILPQIIAAGIQILTALINGITQALPTIVQAAIQIIQALLNGLIQALPSLIEAAIQIIQALINGLTTAMPQIIESAVQIITTLVQGLITALPQLIEGAIQIITALVNALIENLPQIIEAGIQIITALIEGLIQVIPQVIEAIIQILTALIQALIAALPQLIEAGVKLIVALVQGLIQVIPQVIAGIFQILAALLQAILQHLPQLLQAGVQLLQALIQGILSLLGSLLGTIGNMLGQMISRIGSFVGQMLSSGVKLLTSFISGIASMIGNAVGKIGSLGSQIISKAASFAGQMVSAGVNLVQGFINGIGSMVGAAVNAAANMASSALNAVKGFLGIHSPSRVMAKMGVYTGQGFVQGIGNMIRSTRDKAREMAEAVTDALSETKMDIQDNGIVAKVKNIYDKVKDQIPESIPGPNLQDLQDAANTKPIDLYKNEKDRDDDRPKSPDSGGGSVVNIGTIVVRNNDDVDKLSRGLYNKSKETLSGMGNIVTP